MTAALLALAASLSWGLGDMAAALAGRRHTARSVVLVSQVTGLTVGLLLLAVAGREFPGLKASAPALLAGIVLALGMIAYFEALSMGTMSVVAPIAATCGVVPVVVGLAGGERPSSWQAAGIVAVTAGIVLAVYERDRTAASVAGTVEVGMSARDARDPRTGTAAALAGLAAVCFGLTLVGLAAAAEHDPYWPPVAARITSVVVLIFAFVVLRIRPGRGRATHGTLTSELFTGIPAIAVTGAIAAGFCHLSAATLFTLASQRGYLSLVSVLASLSALVVAGLAHLFLHERLERHQALGVVSALTGVLLIAGG